MVRAGIAGLSGTVTADGTTTTDTAETDGDETEDDLATDLDRTLDNLRSADRTGAVDRQPLLESGDIDVAPGEWPLGFPLQGIPRLAVTLNLNYIYNEERGQWERDSGNVAGEGALQRLDSGSVTVSANSFDRVSTTVTDRDLIADARAKIPDGVSVPDPFPIGKGSAGTDNDGLFFIPEWDPSDGRWYVAFHNTAAQSITVDWVFGEVVQR